MQSDEPLDVFETERFVASRLRELGEEYTVDAPLYALPLGNWVDLLSDASIEVVLRALVHVLDTREGTAYALNVTLSPFLDRMENVPPSYLVSIEPCFPLASEGLLPVRESSPHLAFALGKAWKRWEEGALADEPVQGLDAECADGVLNDDYREGFEAGRRSTGCTESRESVPEKDLFADEEESTLAYRDDIDAFNGHAQALATCLLVVAATIPGTYTRGALGILLPFGVACLLYVVKALGDITKGFALKVQGAPLSTLIRLDGFTFGLVLSLAYYLFRGA